MLLWVELWIDYLSFWTITYGGLFKIPNHLFLLLLAEKLHFAASLTAKEMDTEMIKMKRLKWNYRKALNNFFKQLSRQIEFIFNTAFDI